MAQTKNKRGGSTRTTGSARRSNGSRSTATSKRANGSSGTRAAAGRSRSTKPKPSTSTKSQTSIEEGQEQTSTLSEIASKAKTPLLAGGAAVAGLAGGIALARNGRSKGLPIPNVGGSRGKSNIPLPKVSMPKLGKSDSTGKALGATAKALGKTAVEIGKAGYRVGELTAEVRRVREQARND
jgi:hypothetical protein